MASEAPPLPSSMLIFCSSAAALSSSAILLCSSSIEICSSSTCRRYKYMNIYLYINLLAEG
uniref:Ngg1 interacting factor 3 like 1 binding protein 1 n=1 Tax=Arundo donax TaxID=35708 RepID=A0A0A9DM10_ARUDO